MVEIFLQFLRKSIKVQKVNCTLSGSIVFVPDLNPSPVSFHVVIVKSSIILLTIPGRSLHLQNLVLQETSGLNLQKYGFIKANMLTFSSLSLNAQKPQSTQGASSEKQDEFRLLTFGSCIVLKFYVNCVGSFQLSFAVLGPGHKHKKVQPQLVYNGNPEESFRCRNCPFKDQVQTKH